MTRPLVLVVGRWTDRIGRNDSHSVFVPRRLLDAITRAGGEPMMVWPDTIERAERLVGLADGVVLPGGNDLDLRPFGISVVHPREEHPPAEQDAADVTVARAALAAGLPILAICRGMQVLNVIMGGTIHQHFDETTVVHAGQPHQFDVLPGTRLRDLVGSDRISGYSSHHQACDRLADGLVLSAVADDRVIEGFESADGRILGLQWHPEVDAADDPLQQLPFTWLVEQALTPTR
jgi:putative glutamine amidotransferase